MHRFPIVEACQLLSGLSVVALSEVWISFDTMRDADHWYCSLAVLALNVVFWIFLVSSPVRPVGVTAPPCPDCWVQTVLSGSTDYPYENHSLISNRKCFGFLCLPARCSEQQCCIEFTLSALTGLIRALHPLRGAGYLQMRWRTLGNLEVSRAHVLSGIAVGILSLVLRTVISRGRGEYGAVEKTLKGMFTICTLLGFPVVVAL